MRTVLSAVLLSILVAHGCGKQREPNALPKNDDIHNAQAPAAPATPADIDYAAALNERLRKGVTSENNFNVGLWSALGPTVSGEPAPAGYFHALGMQAPPAAGDYFVSLSAYTKQQGAPAPANDLLPKLASQPWSISDSAIVSGWLKANEKPLAVISEAAKRTHNYNPLIPQRDANGSHGLLSSPLPSVPIQREIVLAFAARATRHVNHGQLTRAWEDLFTCHRLARHAARGATLIESLVGVACEIIACRADLTFLEHGNPDARTLQTCLADLSALPPLAHTAEQVDGGERHWTLDTLVLLKQQGVAHLNRVARLTNRSSVIPLTDESLAGTDWDAARDVVNSYFARTTSALREKSRAARTRKLIEIETELGDLHAALPGADATEARNDPARLPVARGKEIGIVVTLMLSPAARKCHEARERAEQTRANLVAAFACVAYHRKHGKYPDKLADLCPAQLTCEPTDLFSEAPLVYRPRDDGFLLYSVGTNGIDDNGHAQDSRPVGDDLVVRFKAASKP